MREETRMTSQPLVPPTTTPNMLPSQPRFLLIGNQEARLTATPIVPPAPLPPPPRSAPAGWPRHLTRVLQPLLEARVQARKEHGGLPLLRLHPGRLRPPRLERLQGVRGHGGLCRQSRQEPRAPSVHVKVYPVPVLFFFVCVCVRVCLCFKLGFGGVWVWP